ncbi:hypothetical protein Pelo_6166 [Pelomyxa schiedti]|nr:hypothetical protein Pelo_6166 [Pelomyxa schiedti]
MERWQRVGIAVAFLLVFVTFYLVGSGGRNDEREQQPRVPPPVYVTPKKATPTVAPHEPWKFKFSEACAGVTPQQPLGTIQTPADLPAMLAARKIAGEAAEIDAPDGSFSDVILQKWPHCKKVYVVSTTASSASNVEVLHGSSQEAARLIPDDSLALVYLNNYDHVFEDLSIWYPKLKLGGIMSGQYKNMAGANATSLFEEAVNTPVYKFSKSVCRQVSFSYRTRRAPSFFFAK